MANRSLLSNSVVNDDSNYTSTFIYACIACTGAILYFIERHGNREKKRWLFLVVLIFRVNISKAASSFSSTTYT